MTQELLIRLPMKNNIGMTLDRISCVYDVRLNGVPIDGRTITYTREILENEMSEPAPPKDFVPKCAEIIALDRTLLCSVCDKNKECIYRKKE